MLCSVKMLVGLYFRVVGELRSVVSQVSIVQTMHLLVQQVGR